MRLSTERCSSSITGRAAGAVTLVSLAWLALQLQEQLLEQLLGLWLIMCPLADCWRRFIVAFLAQMMMALFLLSFISWWLRRNLKGGCHSQGRA